MATVSTKKRLGDLQIVPDGVLKQGVLHYFDEETQTDHKLDLMRVMQTTLLAAMDGYKYLGSCPDIATLRTLEPESHNQQQRVAEYVAGTGLGGGKFVYDAEDTTSIDDGGVVIVTAGGARWKRQCLPTELTVVDFGAAMDGVTDDIDAIIRMYNYTKSLNTAKPIGIRLPAGKIAVSSGKFDLSAAAEQPLFRMRGPHVMFGVVPVTQMYYLDKTSTTPAFQTNARRTEISGISIQGGGDTTVPFYKNVCPGGEYVNVTSFHVDSAGGLLFDLVDTIDTKFNQIYCYGSTGGFLRASWSNQTWGVWDHSTAIEISNSNFSSNKTVQVITAIRAGQSLFRNVWFSNNEYTMDISQGSWLFDTLIIENSTNPVWAQYSKILAVNCRIAQGAAIDNTQSGYDPAMDGEGTIPTWVTNKMDQGRVDINNLGSAFGCGLAAQFGYSETILENTTSAEKWVQVGSVTLQEVGRSAHLKFVGVQGWNSAKNPMSRPGDTGFGGGMAHVFIESKAATSLEYDGGEVHWYGEGATPISAVKFVHYYSTITVYVKLRNYARYTSLFIETNGKARSQTGSPFYVNLTNTNVDDITAVEGIQTAVCRWEVGPGIWHGNGLAMDFDAGKLLLGSTVAKTAGGVMNMPVLFNGEDGYLQKNISPNMTSIQTFTFASLPTPVEGQTGLAFCSNTAKTNPLQLLYCDGTAWSYVHDPDTPVAAAAT